MAIKSQMLEEAKKTETTESFRPCAGFPIHLCQCEPCQRTAVLSNLVCLSEVHGMLVLSFDQFWSLPVLRFAVTPLAPYFLFSNKLKCRDSVALWGHLLQKYKIRKGQPR